MRELCIVPTFQRSALLACCLEHIKAADPEMRVYVFADRNSDESDVCERFGVTQCKTIKHEFHGNSLNVMEALKFGYLEQADRVFIVEDDAMVDPTFFSWCRQALEAHPEVFAACGWQYSPNAVVSEGPDLVIPWYLSVCACIPRKSLYGIVQHARPEYYSDMQGYLDRAYPQSHRRRSMHYEQDGLTLRVCESESKRCIWPRKPRAVHIGFHGYHAGGQALEGTLDEQIEIIKLALANPSTLKALMNGAPAPNMARCERCNKALLTENKTYRAVCVQCFHAEHPDLPVTSSSHYYLGKLSIASAP